MRLFIAVLVTLGLGLAAHMDWHVARPATHHLSLGLSWHWLLAVPVFALVAWYVNSAWPARLLGATLSVVGGGLVLGLLAEPAWEYLLGGAPYEWAFGSLRDMAAVTFTLTGLVAYGVSLSLLRRRARQP